MENYRFTHFWLGYNYPPSSTVEIKYIGIMLKIFHQMTWSWDDIFYYQAFIGVGYNDIFLNKFQ